MGGERDAKTHLAVLIFSLEPNDCDFSISHVTLLHNRCDAEQVFIQDPGEGVGDGDLAGSGVFNLCTLDLWGRIVLCCVSGEEQKLSQDV